MKKGIANWIIISIIVAVLGLLTALMLLQSFGSKLDIDASEINDATCKRKIATLSLELDENPSDWVETTEQVFYWSEMFRASCTPQTDTINPQDWDKCDSSFEEQAILEPTLAATNCAMQQISDRIESCWDMSGSGRRTAFSWSCFNFVISDASETPELSDYAKFKKQLITSFGCDIRDQDCKEIANDVLDDATVIAGLSNLISIKEASIKDKITVCRKETPTDAAGKWGYFELQDSGIIANDASADEKEMVCVSATDRAEQCIIKTGKGLTKIKEKLEDETDTDRDKIDTSCVCPEKTTDEIYAELAEGDIRQTLSKYSSDELVQVEGEEFDCTISQMTSDVKDALDDIKLYEDEAEPFKSSFLRAYNDAHGEPYANSYDELPLQLVKDTKLETGTIEFSEADLENFMKNVPIEARGVKYCDSISYSGQDCVDRLAFYPPEGRFEIRQNKMYSVEYCGDTLPIFSNIVATTICDTGNTEVGRKILITETPTGGGSRLLSENLALNCPITEFAADILPSVFEGPKDICQTGVTRLLQ